ncbi:hypothetical protein F5884DRAFT_36764 [Xylogone sp. PMI_703]|nr:hypothetical protein F5884DRAFT_36764 [Xylogone sp. PMI_703]
MAPKRRVPIPKRRHRYRGYHRSLGINLFDKTGEAVNYVEKLREDSPSLVTFGAMNTSPITALKPKRRHNYFGLGSQNISSEYGLNGSRPEENEQGTNENRPRYPYLLLIPLEVRENVYRYILIHRETILMDHTWSKIEKLSPGDHNIMMICKQIAEESSRFLFKHNVFGAIIRRTSFGSATQQRSLVNTSYLKSLRNVILFFNRDSSARAFQAIAFTCLRKLVDTEVVLDSLTICITPQSVEVERGGATERITTFVNFFHKNACLMKIICKLPCNTLNIVINKLVSPTDDDEETDSVWKRFLIQVDMRHMPTKRYLLSWFANDPAARELAIARFSSTKRELRKLEDRIHEVFQDGEIACERNLCRLMEEGEELESLAYKRP